MSVITFPNTLKMRSSGWSQLRLDLSFKSPFGRQDVELASPLWEAFVEVNAMYERDSGQWDAFLLSLKGRTNQVALWNFARPYPLGTMRGTMTLNVAAAQGATTLQIIAATEATKTLKQGDMLGVGTGTTKQVVKVLADATADVNGIITVSIESALRNALFIGAAVTWDKPTALFRRKDSKTAWTYKPGLVTDGFVVEFIEDART